LEDAGLTYVLDACALIAVLNNEQGSANVRKLLLQATNDEISVFINPVNLLEVYYDLIKTDGLQQADDILQNIYSSAIKILSSIPPAIIREAGRFKTTYKKMSLADAFACATAAVLSADLVTSDHKELEPVAAAESIQFYWFR
jgi:predicted nucleic acid-binding protein